MSAPVYIGADHDVDYSGARDEDGNYLNAGTATWTLKTAAGTTVSTGSCSYIAASNGNYRGVIDGPTVTATLTEGTTYYLYLVFNQGGFDDERRLQLIAAYRQGV